MANKPTYGFTLVEITMVLFIIGILMFSLLPTLAKRTEQQRVLFTQQRLEEVKEALIGHVVQGFLTTSSNENYFPCPAINTEGSERHEEPSLCEENDRKDGFLPWSTLGVEGHDGWGNPFRYRIDSYFSNLNGIYYDIPNSLPGNTRDPILIKDRIGYRLNRDQTNLTQEIKNRQEFFNIDGTLHSNVVAIILSCGKNGRPDGDNAGDTTSTTFICANNSSAEKNNYVQDAYVPGQFDDILVPIPKYVVVNRLARTGQWPPHSTPQ